MKERETCKPQTLGKVHANKTRKLRFIHMFIGIALIFQEFPAIFRE